jgi:hypothetical protein
MKSQRAVFVQRRNAAITEIRLHEGAHHRLRHGEESSCGLRRADLRGMPRTRRRRLRCDARQAQEAASFIGDVVEIDETAALANDVEEIAMLSGGCVGLMFNCT